MRSLRERRDEYFRPIEEQFDKLFNQMFGSDSLHSIRSKSRSSFPKLDVIETNENFVVEVEVPGINPDDLKVEILENQAGLPSNSKILRLTGKKDYQYQYPDTAVFHCREVRRSHFIREVMLPEILVGDPEATYDRGILRLTWQKSQQDVEETVKLIPITKK